jgi:hypothetical protein
MLKNNKFIGLNLSKSSWLLALSISLFGFITGCKSPEDFIGKEFIEAPSDLQVLSFEGTTDLVDFTKDSVGLIGELSHRVSWFVTFTGLKSGAIKTFEGISQSIDPSLFKWGGEHDPQKSIKFFLKDEPVLVEVSFLKSNLVSRDTIVIKETKTFKGDVLFNGFDDDDYDDWPKYLVFDENNDPKNFTATPYLTDDPKGRIVQGERAWGLSGTDYDNTYFIGGIRAMKNDGNDEYFEFQSIQPDLVYFNVFVYGDANTTTRMAIGVAEDDNLDGTYQDASDDVWEYPIKINWVGWKLISVRYVDFIRAANVNYGGGGNGKRELDRVKRITFNLLSDPAGNPANYIVDFPIITYGSPFDPAK